MLQHKKDARKRDRRSKNSMEKVSLDSRYVMIYLTFKYV